MSLILAILAATIIILIREIAKGKPAPHPGSVMVQRYMHPGHTWMKETPDGDAVLGIDDFGQSVIGSIDEVKLPRLLHKVRQGEVGWVVRHGDRTVTMRSPVTGWVIEKNEMVKNRPGLINSSPYGDGWLVKVRPVKLRFQLSNLFTGRAAIKWQDMERAELLRFFSRTPALMFQEGGVLLQNLTDKCSDEEWSSIARQFFHADAHDVVKSKKSNS